jgi:hypothetical protein
MATFTPNLQQTLAGRMFNSIVGAAGTGITIPIYSTTSPTCALWNQLGTGRIVIPVSIQLGVAATGTPAITSLALSMVVNTGASYGSGLPVAAWTDATVFNGRTKYGSSASAAANNQARVGVATTTLTTAGSSFYDLGLSQATTALAAGWVWLEHDFNDKIAMDPGTLIHLVGNPIAPVETMVVSLTWYEVDYVN